MLSRNNYSIEINKEIKQQLKSYLEDKWLQNISILFQILTRNPSSWQINLRRGSKDIKSIDRQLLHVLTFLKFSPKGNISFSFEPKKLKRHSPFMSIIFYI
ncbi:hypothetical protein BpHYR1_021903 [Brachionus plicatilis]|uniref:Uncharacterized protein n=1 Tax=Brachionus plicatilis TaxID=10195 RepID=A0A3M7PRQ7_BRAPC|nr:hypothetical protein BpHYR1_021903 [Brachionus plicatilis]